MRWYKRMSAVCILPCLHGHAQGHATVRSRDSDRIRYVIKRGPRSAHLQQSNSKVWKTRIHLCQFLENIQTKKRRLHIKKIILLPLDCLWTPTWPPFNVFGAPLYSRLGVRVETLYTAVKFVFVFRSRIHVQKLLLTHLLLQLIHFGYQVIYLFQGPWNMKREPLKNLRYVIQL